MAACRLDSLTKSHSQDVGFTLVEIAVALLVVALLLGIVLVPLQTQFTQRKIAETQTSA